MARTPSQRPDGVSVAGAAQTPRTLPWRGNPDGRRTPLPSGSERLSLGPFDQCGVWRVVGDEQDTTLLELACNLADRNESDVRVAKADDATSISVVSASLLGNRPVSVWLIALVWMLMAIEWWAYQRRVIE